MRSLLLPALAFSVGLVACTSSDTTQKTASVSDASPAPMIAELGRMAPDFTLKDINGKQVALKDFRGKTVVLEWFNPECPFVVYAYQSGPLMDMAARCAKDGVVWLSINSGAPGMQGAGMDANMTAYKGWNMKSNVLFDPSGTVGTMYKAKSTPHMFVVDAKGMLAYQGALDNAPSGQIEGKGYTNYVDAALMDLRSGKKISTPDTKPYGCSVKYKN